MKLLQKAPNRCPRSHRSRYLVSEIQGLCHFESGDNLPGFWPISICLSGSMFLSPKQCACVWGAQSYFLGTRWGLFIKSSPAVEADSVFTPFMHSANIVPITDKDKSKLHSERSALPRVFNSGDSQKPPNTSFSIFMLLNLDLRFTTVDHLSSF